MPRHEDERTVRKHVHLFPSDWEALEELFGQTIGISKAVRTIIRGYLRGLDTKSQELQRRVSAELDIDSLPPPKP